MVVIADTVEGLSDLLASSASKSSHWKLSHHFSTDEYDGYLSINVSSIHSWTFLWSFLLQEKEPHDTPVFHVWKFHTFCWHRSVNDLNKLQNLALKSCKLALYNITLTLSSATVTKLPSDSGRWVRLITFQHQLARCSLSSGKRGFFFRVNFLVKCRNLDYTRETIFLFYSS